MELTVERTGPCQARVTFRVPAADYEQQRRHHLSEVASRANLRGFRPGKVPPAIVAKQYGDQIDSQTKEHFLRLAFQQAVERDKLRPAAWPRVLLEQLQVATGGEFAHTFEVALRPDIALAKYDGLAVDAQPTDVSEVEIDAALDDLRRQQSRPEPAGDGGLPADGLALAAVEYLHEGQSVWKREGLRLTPGAPIPGASGEAVSAALLGAREGETRELQVQFPADWEREDLRGRPGTCRVTATKVFRVVPPSEADLLRATQTTDAAALRQKAGEHLRALKEGRERQRVETLLFEQVLAAHPMELPEELIESQAKARVDALRAELEKQGQDTAAARARAEGELGEAREAARRALAAAFLVEAIAAAEKLQVAERDFALEMAEIARRNRATIDEVREFYQKNTALRDQLALELLERKVRSFLRERAVVAPPA